MFEHAFVATVDVECYLAAAMRPKMRYSTSTWSTRLSASTIQLGDFLFPTRVSWMSGLIYGKWMLWKKLSKRYCLIIHMVETPKITLVLCSNKLQTFPFIHQTHPFWRNHCAIIKKKDCSLHAAKKIPRSQPTIAPGMFGLFGSPGFWTMAAPSSIHFDFQSSRVMQGPATWQLRGLELQDSAIVTLFGGGMRSLRDTKSRGCWWPPSK